MEAMEAWTVYFNPSDFPGKYVARKSLITKVFTNTNEYHVADTLHEVRRKAPLRDKFRIERSLGDDPCIVEVWI